MKTLFIAMSIGSAIFAQGPVTDKVKVTFENPVRVGDARLAAGQYVIRQLPSASSPRMLEFASEDGTKLETTIAAMPVYDNGSVPETKVELEVVGGEQYVKRIWVQGKSYGYELLPPKEVAKLPSAKDDSVQLNAQYTPTKPVEVAQAEPQSPAVTATPAPEPVNVAPAPAPQEAQREEQKPSAAEPTPAMPKTADHWATAIAVGALMTGLGLLVVRRSYGV